MTQAWTDPTLEPPEATQAAVAAATAADVVLRELHRIEELKAAQRLFMEVWRPAEGQPPPMTVELLRALSHAGSYVVGAYAGTRMVGASAGFFTAPPEPGLHSHITGVAPQGQHQGIGFALKVHQRAWALARGVATVVWTFDPLVARNAWFNLAKLGAAPTAYLEDFYGPMTDAINAGMASDRLLVTWNLNDPAVAAACAGRPRQPALGRATAEPALTVGPDLAPVAHDIQAPLSTVAVPPDAEALDPERRRAWRAAVRQALGDRMAAGAVVTGFLRRPDRYLVERPPAGGAR
ncbi:MAG TPA: GNAT family N-acetyltransferase [Actinomycetota bacterium]|jgi:predicted GNAT superfamily acetyltransferase|nr:GNAT family N-acetyltransferase [Actinomycetota bacterium]